MQYTISLKKITRILILETFQYFLIHHHTHTHKIQKTTTVKYTEKKTDTPIPESEPAFKTRIKIDAKEKKKR